MIESTTTLYGLCQLIQISGNPLTTAAYKISGMAGEKTPLIKCFENGGGAELTRTFKGKAKNHMCLTITDPLNKELWKMPFVVGPIFDHSLLTLNKSREQAIITKQGKLLNILIHKDPSCLQNCLSNPQYWHSHWPYTCSKQQHLYAPVDFEDRAYAKFLKGDEEILADMNYLIKNIVPFQPKQSTGRSLLKVA